jgi:hypothetical protein
MKKHATCHCLLFSVCTALVITTDATAAEKAVAQSVDSALVVSLRRPSSTLIF